jgi:molecular chaperone HscB
MAKDYFELFGLPVSLKVDRAEVRKRYFEQSRKHHPDYFVNNGDAAQQDALESSALLNHALKTLSDPDATIGYVLRQKGILEEEEKYTLPPAFLMEMMEVNEELAELEFEDDGGGKAQMAARIDEIEKEIYEPVKDIIEGYQEGVTSGQAMLQVKDYYMKKKYLLRLRQQLAGKT